MGRTSSCHGYPPKPRSATSFRRRGGARQAAPLPTARLPCSCRWTVFAGSWRRAGVVLVQPAARDPSPLQQSRARWRMAMGAAPAVQQVVLLLQQAAAKQAAIQHVAAARGTQSGALRPVPPELQMRPLLPLLAAQATQPTLRLALHQGAAAALPARAAAGSWPQRAAAGALPRCARGRTPSSSNSSSSRHLSSCACRSATSSTRPSCLPCWATEGGRNTSSLASTGAWRSYPPACMTVYASFLQACPTSWPARIPIHLPMGSDYPLGLPLQGPRRVRPVLDRRLPIRARPQTTFAAGEEVGGATSATCCRPAPRLLFPSRRPFPNPTSSRPTGCFYLQLDCE